MDKIQENILLLERGELLTTLERNIFSTILSHCNDFNPPVVLRVAGGWVRDKLLGKESDDLDIAVENTTGIKFAEVLKNNTSNNVKVVVIEANPDQSKHLETARVCLFSDFWIDFCGLRSDEYAHESRIPKIRQGTPLEDAKRRDLTINALFFNINENKIEDWTNGIEDLKNGIIRTPLEPIESFRDDPLRVLRSFRFASKLGFKLHESIIPAAREIKEDFKRKIKRERITTELLKAFNGKEPLNALKYLVESELFDTVFDPEGRWNIDPNEALKRVLLVINRYSHDNMFLVLTMSAIFAPIINQPKIADPERKHKFINPIEYTVSRILKFPIKVSNDVHKILKSAYDLGQIKKPFTRLTIGNWIRKSGSLWIFANYLLFDENQYNFYVNEIYPYIEEQQLQNCWEIKPLFKGAELAKIHNIKPGKKLKEYIEKLLDWQIENPDGTKDEYIEYINKK